MTQFIMPGEIAPDGRTVLDIETTGGNFGQFGEVGRTRVPLPPGSRVAINGAPEGLFVRPAMMPNPAEEGGDPLPYPLMVPGFASIDVVFARKGADDPLSEGLTHANLSAGIESGAVTLSQHPARLLHPFTHQGVYAAHAENLNDPRIGRQSVADRTADIVRSVVVSSPSIIEPQRSHEPRFATVIPLTQNDPSDPFIEADIMVQIGHSGNEIPPHVIIHSAEDPYDASRVARVVIGTVELRSPHPVTRDGRNIDYGGLEWRVAAVEPRPAGNINIDMESMPRVAAVMLTTSCLDVTTLETPAGVGGVGGSRSPHGNFGVNPASIFGDGQTGPRAIG